MCEDEKAREAAVKARIEAAAGRALAEAEARRRAAPAKPPRRKEIAGPEGPEPTRFGDWEKNGIASDF